MSDPSSYVYQVLNWDRLFENNKSRERDQLHFVCVPNKQDGMGLTRVLNHPNGAAIYGIWQLILGACSRQTRPRDGWLTDTGRAPDGQEAGTPWTPEDLALRWRRPVAEIEETLRVLSAPNIQWIRALPLKVPVECPDSALQVPVRCLGTEREGTNGTEPPIPPEGVPGEERVPDRIGDKHCFKHATSITPRKPASLQQVIEKGQFIGMAEQDCRDWFRDCEACNWCRGDGTPFDNWARQMVIHRDALRQRQAQTPTNNKRPYSPNI